MTRNGTQLLENYSESAAAKTTPPTIPSAKNISVYTVRPDFLAQGFTAYHYEASHISQLCHVMIVGARGRRFMAKLLYISRYGMHPGGAYKIC